MATSYYYFISGLPSQNMEDTKTLLTPVMFLHQAEEHLTPDDFELLKLIMMPNNLDNLINTIHGKSEWQTESTITQAEWEDVIAQVKELEGDPSYKSKIKGVKLPDFVIDFIRMAFEPDTLAPPEIMSADLYTAFYACECKNSNPFIRNWFQFDQDMRNIIVALNCRKHNLPCTDQIIGDNEIAEKLQTSHVADFGLGKAFPLFDQLSRINDLPDIIDKEKGFDLLRWKWIDSTNFFEYFSIDRILGYFCKLRIQYRWVHLSQSLGENRFNLVLKGLENSFEFPEEFALRKR